MAKTSFRDLEIGELFAFPGHPEQVRIKITSRSFARSRSKGGGLERVTVASVSQPVVSLVQFLSGPQNEALKVVIEGKATTREQENHYMDAIELVARTRMRQARRAA